MAGTCAEKVVISPSSLLQSAIDPVFNAYNMMQLVSNHKNPYINKAFNDMATILKSNALPPREDFGNNPCAYIATLLRFMGLNVYDDILTRYSNNSIKLYETPGGIITENDFNKTLNAIKNGIPILLQVPLMNEQLRLRGVADIVIRSDWINRIYKREVIPKNEQKTPSGRYYYVVIDIKYTSMTLCANGYTIRNDGRFKGYKGQLLIYNIALGLIQNYIPYYIFLMSFYLIMMVEHLQ